MARIRVVTDSASDLPEMFAQSLNVDVVSLTIRFGDEEFVDRVDLTPDAFWAKCKVSKTLPETAAPSPGAFQAIYERAKSDGCDGVVVLTLSSLLSATHQSATLGAEAVEGLIPVKVIDTLNVSMGQGLLVIEAAELAKSGATIEEIVARTTQLIKRSGVVATLDTLDHLIKGGRVGGAKALLGQVLSIKPLIELKEGVVAEAGRQRTRAKALAAVANAAARPRAAAATRANSRRCKRCRHARSPRPRHQNRVSPHRHRHRPRRWHPRRPRNHRAHLDRGLESPVGSLVVTDARPEHDPDLVDRLLGMLDHGLDVVHDRVLRPIILAARAIAYGLIIVLAAIVFVIVLVIGFIRLLNIYAFSGREWLSYVVVGVLSLLAGMIIWRRRRPLKLRK